jgi:DNA-binding NtrC family response regulator
MSERKDPTLSMSTPARPPVDAAWLVVDPDTPAARRVRIADRPIRIGSAPGAELRLEDPHVSRRHAEVKRQNDGVVVADVGSRNGTFVNGIPIKEALLTPGATITVGTTSIRFDSDRGATRAAGTQPPVGFGGAVGSSEAMQEVFDVLRKLAPTDLSVTILGETGVGKDVLARAIHAESGRAGGPFAVFDCGAVAPNLIESELFGHDRGAFTGALAEHQGAFERAHGGTLFLDEIGELPLDLQPRLLRSLETRKVRRLGGARPRPVDVRVVAATNRDLEEEVGAGRFRRDLFFRLSSAVVRVPPLRERAGDIPALVADALAELGRPLQLAPGTLAALESYDWPGNVRELKNVIASAAAFADGATLEPRHLLFFRPKTRPPTLDSLPLAGRTLEMLERAAIRQTLDQEGGNKTRTARALGIAPSTLYEKLKKYGL